MVRPRVLLALLACAQASAAHVLSRSPSSVEARAAGPGAAVPGPVLALALLPGDRLAVLGRDTVRVYRSRAGELVRLSERTLPEAQPVRFPGGLLAVTEDAVWVQRSGLPRALLLALDEGGALVERGQAEAFPWPGCPRGLRYRDGTNLLEGAAVGLGDGPFLAVADGVGVDPEGRVLLASAEGPRPSGLRAGPALVSLGDGLFAAASASAPGPADTILIFEREEDELRLLHELSTPGAVRALAAAPGNGRVRLLAAVEAGEGVSIFPFSVRRAPR